MAAAATIIASTSEAVFLVGAAGSTPTGLLAAAVKAHAPLLIKGDLPEGSGAGDVLRWARQQDHKAVVTVVAGSSKELLAMLPQLHDLAKEKRAAVAVHVYVESMAHLAAVRHIAETVVLSRTPAEAAVKAGATQLLALRAATSVVLHGICANVAISDNAIAEPVLAQIAAIKQQQPREEAVDALLHGAFKLPAVVYAGAQAPSALLVAFNTPAVGQILLDLAANNPSVGVLVIGQYRPLPSAEIAPWITKSNLKLIRVVDEDSVDAWGPLFVDVLSLTQQVLEGHNTSIVPEVVGSAITPEQAQQLITASVQGIETPVLQKAETDDDQMEVAPSSENELALPYLKMLAQVFGNRLEISNGVGSSSVWGPSSTQNINTGFGKVLASIEESESIAAKVSELLRDASVTLSKDLHTALSAWLQTHSGDAKKNADVAAKVVALLAQEHSSHPKLQALYESHELLAPKSRWLIGGDVWAHDPGNSGVHSVIASKSKVNMLLLDSAVYSADPSAAASSAQRKKDLGLYALNYGGVYVASISVFSSYAQALRAFMEAEAYPGPSLVLAYAPDVKEEAYVTTKSPFTSSSKALAVLKESKLAVDQGKWPLYRNDPAATPSFQLDSDKLKADLQTFVNRENQLSLLISSQGPSYAPGTVPASVEEDLKARHTATIKRDAAAAFGDLVAGLKGDPLLILYGSDGGHAEELARRMHSEGTRRNKAVRLMAMDEYEEIDELASEETLIVIVSTAGQGEMPSNAREFWKGLTAATTQRLESVSFAVFSLGDSHYWPRPEDKHYFCKAGLDVQKRLEELGAKPLLPCGIGNDQDLDGFETGFQAWWPQIWKTLTKEGEIVPEAAAAPVSTSKTPEQVKAVSQFLRGTIAQGLLDESTGALAEDDTVLTKFHGIYQQDDRDLREERRKLKQEKAFSFMVRVRVPGGVCTSAQWIQMDDIADKHANGTIRLTTRQAFQFHGIIKKQLRLSIRAINQVLMDTLAACGDVNRNVMCTPNPYASQVHYEVWDFARKLSEHLSPRTSAYHEIWLSDTQVAGNAVQDVEPIYGPLYLPRKFKTAIAIPPSNDVDVLAHDLGYIAVIDADGTLAGFNVTIGGGMGMTHNNNKTYPRLGDMLGFCTTDQAIDVGEKVLTVQRDFGDRTNRKHARLKYTVEDNGIDWYRSQVEERLGYKLQPARPFQFSDNADRYGWTQGLNNTWHFTFFVQNGRIKDTPDYQLKTGLREIAKVHKGDFRLTANQNLIISNVAAADRPTIEALLQRYNIGSSRHSGLRLNSMACVALPTCGLAFAESERYLPDLVSRIETTLEEVGLRDDAITVRMTGCPNGCARPYIAEIGFVGKAPGVYNMYLGGGFDGNRLNKLFKESINEEQILAELRPLLKRYAEERVVGEHFGDFVVRIGVVKPVIVASRDFHA